MAVINDTDLRQLLLKEQQGALSTDERKILDDWYNSFDGTGQNLSVFRDTVHEEQVRERLLNRIMESGFPIRTDSKKPTQKIILLRWISIAAIFLMVIGGAIIWQQKGFKKEEIWLSAQTGNGIIKKIKLEDGSDIWLNAGSKLRYPKHFDQHQRQVYLEGEAYFDIAHDPDRPFSVQTDYLNTSVLGTAFAVTAYRNMPLRVVTVIRGRVQVAHGSEVLGFLTPNKRIEYHVDDNKSFFSTAEGLSAMSWKEGKLQFVNQDMQDIAARLDRWYGYRFIFENNDSRNCRYTASFNSQIPLPNLLKVMKAISLVRYRIDTTKKTVTFLGSGCN